MSIGWSFIAVPFRSVALVIGPFRRPQHRGGDGRVDGRHLQMRPGAAFAYVRGGEVLFAPGSIVGLVVGHRVSFQSPKKTGSFGSAITATAMAALTVAGCSVSRAL